jgi:transcriptional regulator with XRE-family HTH domain
MPLPLQASQASVGARLRPLAPPAPRRRRTRAEMALPPEVLDSEVDKADLFIERMDEWRRAWGWSHEQFAAYLGVSVPYWRDLRTGRRRLTLTVALRVIQERPEMGAILGDPFRYFAERDRKRGLRRALAPGDRPVSWEEAKPEGR